jgi:hypothetical protein
MLQVRSQPIEAEDLAGMRVAALAEHAASTEGRAPRPPLSPKGLQEILARAAPGRPGPRDLS